MIELADKHHNGVPEDHHSDRERLGKPDVAIHDGTVATLLAVAMELQSIAAQEPMTMRDVLLSQPHLPRAARRLLEGRRYSFVNPGNATAANVAQQLNATMSQKFVDQSGSSSENLIFGWSESLCHLSDGTAVWCECDPTNAAYYYLMYSSDHSTSHQIAHVNTGTTAPQSAWRGSIAVDASDNIYVVFAPGGGSTLIAQAYTKGSGYAWTQQTALSPIVTVNSTHPSSMTDVRWCNTGGGTGSHGHLVCVGADGNNDLYYCALDAGSLLAGSGSPVTSSGEPATALLATNGAQLASSSGFGSTSGIVVSTYSTNFYAASWSINSSGVITASVAGTGYYSISGWNSTTSLPWTLIAGSSSYLIVSRGSTSGHISAQILNSSAQFQGSPTDWGTPTGAPSVTGYAFAVMPDPSVANQAWVLAAPATTTNPFVRVSVDFGSGSVVWATAATNDDTLTGIYSNSSSSISFMSTVRAPRGTTVDWLVQTQISATPTFAIYGDSTVFLSAPNAPTLVSPANASYQDVSSGLTFTATYNSTDGYNQSAYSMRIKVSGGSYQYWNAGTNALQSSQVWNSISTAPGANFSVTLPNTAISDGNVYNWSFASQEAGASLDGPFASDFTFTAQAPPSVTVSSPTGTVTGTTQPDCAWTGTFPSGAVQTAYQIIVEAGTYSTTPGSGTQVWTSGTVTSSAVTVTLGSGGTPSGVNFTPNITYRCFVQLTESGGQTSNWGYTTFTIQTDVPATPAISASPTTDPTTGCPMIQVTVQACDNMLTANQSSLESDATTGWSASVNCSIAASNAEALDGAYSLALTSTAAGRMDAATPSGTSGFSVIGGNWYSLLAYFYSASATGLNGYVIAYWYDSSGASLSNASGSAATITTTGWAQSSLVVQAPSNAAYAQVVVSAQNPAGAGVVVYVDCIGLFPARVSAAADANLVPDSDFRYALNTNGLSDATEQGWNLVSPSGGGWSTANGAAIATGAGYAFDEVGSPGPSLIPLTPGTTMTLSCRIDSTKSAAATPRVFLADPTNTTLYAAASQAAQTNSVVSVTFAVPVGVTVGRVFFDIGGVTFAAGETLTFSQPQLTATSSVQPYSEGPTWSLGGFVGNTTIQVTRSDGLYVRGASQANPATVPSVSQKVVLNDYEVTPGGTYTYTAAASSTLIAGASSTPTGSVTLSTTYWWFEDPLDSSKNTSFEVSAHATSVTEQSASHLQLGQKYATVLSSVVGGTDGSITIRTYTAAEWAALQALITSQHTLWIISPFDEAWYVRLGPMPGGQSGGNGNQVRQSQAQQSTAGAPIRETTMQMIAQARPAV